MSLTDNLARVARERLPEEAAKAADAFLDNLPGIVANIRHPKALEVAGAMAEVLGEHRNAFRHVGAEGTIVALSRLGLGHDLANVANQETLADLLAGSEIDATIVAEAKAREVAAANIASSIIAKVGRAGLATAMAILLDGLNF